MRACKVAPMLSLWCPMLSLWEEWPSFSGLFRPFLSVARNKYLHFRKEEIREMLLGAWFRPIGRLWLRRRLFKNAKKYLPRSAWGGVGEGEKRNRKRGFPPFRKGGSVDVANTTSGCWAKLRNYICGDTVGADQLELVARVLLANARCSVKIGGVPPQSCGKQDLPVTAPL